MWGIKGGWVITHMTAQLLKLLLLNLLTSCLCQLQLALNLSLQLIHLLKHSCPNTLHLLLLSSGHTQHSTLNTHMQQCFTYMFKHNGTLLKVCAVAQRKLHCQNPTVSWNYAHLQHQSHSHTPFKTRCTITTLDMNYPEWRFSFRFSQPFQASAGLVLSTDHNCTFPNDNYLPFMIIFHPTQYTASAF